MELRETPLVSISPMTRNISLGISCPLDLDIWEKQNESFARFDIQTSRRLKGAKAIIGREQERFYLIRRNRNRRFESTDNPLYCGFKSGLQTDRRYPFSLGNLVFIVIPGYKMICTQ